MANLRDRVKTILPWDNAELEELLSELIAHGTEAAKVDFKLEVEASTPEQKTDLLTDISAIANTYDETYEDHGFLLYGIKGKVIFGTTKTETDVDKLQNHIEQLLKTYISPMPQIYVAGFVTPTGKRWGAIVVPPRNAKPYMFFKEFQCANPKHTRRKGDWFVRRGATTDHGLPEDLALITQKQTEQLLEPLRESVRSLQLRLSKTEDQYNSALFKKISDLPMAPVSNQEERGGLEAYTPEDFSIDLSTVVSG